MLEDCKPSQSKKFVREDFDYKNPDYVSVFRSRVEALNRIRANPDKLQTLKAFYRENPSNFIDDWGCTSDPRNAAVGRPVVLPFLLFERQREWVNWFMESWRTSRPGVTPKSRESGISWLAIALSCTLCLFHDGLVAGFGSSKSELVDKLGNPNSLFWKAREFMALLPREFRGTWTRDDAPEMRIKFPDSGSVIVGEGGDNLGRGGRTAFYIVDEAASLERPQLVEASLSATTNCRIDISTPRGMGNPFHTKVTTWPAERVFFFHWRSDPRKDEAWYQDQLSKLDAVTIAQEVDIDFAASIEGVLIPSAWVQAAVDAHRKLGIVPTGARRAALDVSDQGPDTNALCGAHGVLVDLMEEWSGKGSDIFRTAQRAYDLCDTHGYDSLKYDADGLGSSIRGAARIINEQRVKQGIKPLAADPFQGSGKVFEPTRKDANSGRLNQDMFLNCKAQSWWAVRTRFQATFRAVTEGVTCPPDSIISLSPSLPLLAQLCGELSQPTYTINGVGKIVVDKTPEGARSPNLADALMIRFSQTTRAPLTVSTAALALI